MIDDPQEGAGDAPSEGDGAPSAEPVIPSDAALPADLRELTVEQLTGVAKRRRIGGYSSLSKDELVDAITESLRQRPPTL